jgi:AraC-like DNA-binding protein
MRVLDTTTLSPSERADAYQATVSANCSSSMAIFEDAATFSADLHVYDLGTATVFNIDASGNTLRRTPQMSRAADKCEITLALPMKTMNRLAWGQDDVVYGPTDLMLVDLSAPYVYRWEGDGASYALHVDYERLGLPMDVIYRASARLRSSPLYGLVRDHVARTVTDAATIERSGAAASVGAASAELMRALIVTAAGDSGRLDDSLQTSMAARVQAYVRMHLREPDLGPERIAADNGLSVRALYTVYESLGVSLEQSIIEQRLLGARSDLSAERPRFDSIGALARAWGFSSPSFFSSRFRQAFGVTPTQWRDGIRDDVDVRRGSGTS